MNHSTRPTTLILLLVLIGPTVAIRGQAQGQSPVATTPVTAQPSTPATSPALTPKSAVSTAERLKTIITHLSETIGERNLFQPENLNQAADYIDKHFETLGYKVERQKFEVQNRPCYNLIVQVDGMDKPDEIVLFGAHYDTARGTPGANDNGTGIAALMVIAEQLSHKRFGKTVRFVAFTNEEPPFFQREAQMGSWVYAKSCRKRGDNLKVVVSLETMGYFTDEPNSQQYPPLLAAAYPSTGNFIGFVSNIPSRQLLLDASKSFKKHCSVDAQIASLPGNLQGVGWSDHWSFWQEGYPGIMITDTALFRYPHYHESTDTVDKIEFVRYAQVVDGLAKVLAEFAEAK